MGDAANDAGNTVEGAAAEAGDNVDAAGDHIESGAEDAKEKGEGM